MTSDSAAHSNRALWGYYVMRVNADHTAITVEPGRGICWHLNALGILQAYDPKAVSLGDMADLGDGSIVVAVNLKHPLAGMPKYTAFDIRGIVMFPAQHTFPNLKLELPGFSIGETALLNADGYTRRWNPTEFSGKEFPFNYFDGKLIPVGMGAKATSQVNPYRCFYTNSKRRYFSSGAIDTRHFHLSFAPGPMVFGYAVDASWGEPTMDLDLKTGEPLSIPESFALTANSIEPYEIRLSSTQGELQCSLGIYAGGSQSLVVQVNDWYTGASVPLTSIMVEAPDLFSGTLNPVVSEGNKKSCAYNVVIPNNAAVTPGTYPVLFSLICPETDDTFVPDTPLTAYQVFLVNVVEISPPFCNGKVAIHNVFQGSYNLSGSPGALHMDCSFLSPMVGGTGGLLFDGGILGGNELIQAAAIPGHGGNATANTLFQRKGALAGRANVVQSNDYNGHLLITTDADADNLLIYTSSGIQLREYDLGDGENGRNEPVALAADPSNGSVWFIGHKGSQGIDLERWAYVEESGSFDYISDPASTVDLMPWLGTTPKPLGIALNSELNFLYVLHAKDQGSIEVFDISKVPPVHVDKYSISNVFDQPIQPFSVSGFRKLLGADLIIDHADGEDPAKCRMLAFANTTDGGSKLVRLDAWGQKLSSAPLGSPFSCMAINNLPGASNRLLVLFPTVPSTNYVAFLAPPDGW